MNNRVRNLEGTKTLPQDEGKCEKSIRNVECRLKEIEGVVCTLFFDLICFTFRFTHSPIVIPFPFINFSAPMSAEEFAPKYKKEKLVVKRKKKTK